MYLLILSHIQRGEDSTIDPCVPPTGANQSSSGQAGTSVFQRGFESLTFDMEHHGTTLKWWGPRLFIGIPLSEYDNHQYSGYSIIPYNHQPTRVLNTAHWLMEIFIQLVRTDLIRIELSYCRQFWALLVDICSANGSTLSCAGSFFAALLRGHWWSPIP